LIEVERRGDIEIVKRSESQLAAYWQMVNKLMSSRRGENAGRGVSLRRVNYRYLFIAGEVLPGIGETRRKMGGCGKKAWKAHGGRG